MDCKYVCICQISLVVGYAKLILHIFYLKMNKSANKVLNRYVFLSGVVNNFETNLCVYICII